MEYHIRVGQRRLTALSVECRRREYQLVRAHLILIQCRIFVILLIASARLSCRTTLIVGAEPILNLRHRFLILNACRHQYGLTFLCLAQTFVYLLYLLLEQL